MHNKIITQKRILLCTKIDEVVGSGHAIRCKALLNNLKIDYKLSILGGGELIKKYFPDAIFYKVDNFKEVEGVDSLLENVDLIIADIPFYCEIDWNIFKKSNSKLVIFDDHGGSLPGDLIINGGVFHGYHDYKNVKPTAKLCLGGEYAILREEFTSSRWIDTKNKVLTIIVGSGADASRWLLNLIPQVFQFNVQKINIVVSSTFAPYEILESLCYKGDISLHKDLNANQLRQLMSQSSLLLVTAGMVLYEAIAYGAPVIAYPQIDDLVAEAEWFAKKGACINIGKENFSPSYAIDSVNKLINDFSKKRNMSHAQLMVIDGSGINRVTNEIKKLLKVHL